MFHDFWPFWNLLSMSDPQLEMLSSLRLHNTLFSYLSITPFLFPSLFFFILLPTKYVALLKVGTLTKMCRLTEYVQRVSQRSVLDAHAYVFPFYCFCHGKPILFPPSNTISLVIISIKISLKSSSATLCLSWASLLSNCLRNIQNGVLGSQNQHMFPPTSPQLAPHYSQFLTLPFTHSNLKLQCYIWFFFFLHLSHTLNH